MLGLKVADRMNPALRQIPTVPSSFSVHVQRICDWQEEVRALQSEGRQKLMAVGAL